MVSAGGWYGADSDCLIPQKTVSALYTSKNIAKVCLENCLLYSLLSDSSELDVTWKSSLVKIQMWRTGPEGLGCTENRRQSPKMFLMGSYAPDKSRSFYVALFCFILIKSTKEGIPCCPVVSTPGFCCQGSGFNP